MTRLTISRLTKESYAIFGPSMPPLRDLEPIRILERINRAMTWLLGQEKPHEIVLDDTSGIAAAMIAAWLTTNDYPCSVLLLLPGDKRIALLGILPNGHAFLTALADDL